MPVHGALLWLKTKQTIYSVCLEYNPWFILLKRMLVTQITAKLCNLEQFHNNKWDNLCYKSSLLWMVAKNFADKSLNHYLHFFVVMFYSKPDLEENAKQGLNKLLANEVPIEIKPVNPPHFYRLAASEPKKLFWVRARGHIGKKILRRICFAYMTTTEWHLYYSM